MRLDHLLSKEHLAPQLAGGVQTRLSDECSDPELKGGTLTSSVEWRSPRPVQLSVRGAGTGGGGHGTVGTLLGPEGAEMVSAASDRVAPPAPRQGTSWFAGPACGPGRTICPSYGGRPGMSVPGVGRAWRSGRWSVRTLRTAQWTRASLWPSY